MKRRIALRAGGLVAVALAVVAGLTVYFSKQGVPPCLFNGVNTWSPPTDKQVHHFLLVAPDHALCLFDMDAQQAPAGYVPLPNIRGITALEARGGQVAVRYDGGRGALVDLRTNHVRYGVPPPPAPTNDAVARNLAARVEYATMPGRLGFQVRRLDTGELLDTVSFPGYTWSPRAGPNPPDHGISLAPDRPELWVLDAPNSVVHVYDVEGKLAVHPRLVDTIKLTRKLTGVERPCASASCVRIGALLHSADGRFVFVGDVGDVIDTSRREEIANLEALRQSRVMLEVDWANGEPEFP